MIIECFRCGKKINTPDSSNADYIMAEDTKAKEPRNIFVALKHNQTTLAKVERVKQDDTKRKGHPPTEDFIRNKFKDSEYTPVEVPSMEVATKAIGEDLVKVVVETREKDIQKTGIICPDCHKETDFVIWGVHKAGKE